jgi:hypothetical protein
VDINIHDIGFYIAFVAALWSACKALGYMEYMFLFFSLLVSCFFHSAELYAAQWISITIGVLVFGDLQFLNGRFSNRSILGSR